MIEETSRRQPDDAETADLWAALLADAPRPAVNGGRALAAPAWKDEADDLEAMVRQHGGRLPGSDPRR